MKPAKIFFYSHDTFGLGHIRRTQKIANALAGGERSILIACASPKASSFASRPGIDYLNLPGFTKQAAGDYVPRSLKITIDEFTHLRSQLLLSAVRSFRPDIVFVDKEPLGVKRELYPALEFFRSHLRSTRVICGFRDILDEKEAVVEEWRRRDTLRALRIFFDSIFVYGEKDIFCLEDEYQLPEDLAAKVQYTGYIHPSEFPDHPQSDFHFADESRPLVTLTLGGGGDGKDILGVFTDYLERSNLAKRCNHVVLTGPFLSPEAYRQLTALHNRSEQILVREFVPDPHAVFGRSNIVLSMGGYNTMCELASMGKRPLILPRVKPRREQLIRAQVFERHGFCDFIPPERLSVEELERKISLSLNNKLEPNAFPTRGLDSVRDFVNEFEGSGR